jgi:hypothetical protein
MAGEVRIDGRVAAKASDSVQEGHEITVAPRSRYVGAGGLSSRERLAHFQVSCSGKVALDIGAVDRRFYRLSTPARHGEGFRRRCRARTISLEDSGRSTRQSLWKRRTRATFPT